MKKFGEDIDHNLNKKEPDSTCAGLPSIQNLVRIPDNKFAMSDNCKTSNGINVTPTENSRSVRASRTHFIVSELFSKRGLKRKAPFSPKAKKQEVYF